MRFHILGLGPIGSLIAHNLRRALPRDTSITLIHKNAEQALSRGRAIQIECNGVVTKSTRFRSEVFEGPSGMPKFRRDPSAGATSQRFSGDREEEEDLYPIQSLLITAKAHQTLPAIQRLQPRLSPSSTIVLLQNGMGIYEELVTHVFRNPEQRPHFILASNSHGAYCSQDRIIHAGLGSLEFGILPDYHGRNYEAGYNDRSTDGTEPRLHIHDIASPGDPHYERYESLRSTVAAFLLLDQLNVSWKPVASLQLAMRRKLVVNAVINPLTALMRCRNGDVLKAPGAAEIMSKVCEEASSVFAAQIKSETLEWFSELSSQGIDTSLVDPGRIPPMLMPTNLEREVARVARVTAGNKSSMLSDIEKGRGTEIDYINGYLLKLASLYNIPVPTTSTLYHLVKMRSAIPIDQM